MAAPAPIRRVVTIVRLWRPQTYFQVWLSAVSLPLAVLIVGSGLRLIFRTWPQFDIHGVFGAVGYVVIRASAGSRALRTRRKILGLAASSDGRP